MGKGEWREKGGVKYIGEGFVLGERERLIVERGYRIKKGVKEKEED